MKANPVEVYSDDIQSKKNKLLNRLAQQQHAPGRIGIQN